jgi:hypothetical protein
MDPAVLATVLCLLIGACGYLAWCLTSPVPWDTKALAGLGGLIIIVLPWHRLW